MTATVRGLLDTIGRLRLDGCDDLLDMTLGSWSWDDWREVLLNLPTDGDTLSAQFEISWDVSILVLEQWCLRFKDRDEEQQRDQRLFGFVGVLVLTMISLRHSERRRLPTSDIGEQSTDELDHADYSHTCQRFVREDAVQDALRELYAPPSVAPDDITVQEWKSIGKEWESIDFGTLNFHRHGTTSFILKGRVGKRSHGEVKTFALKCIIYPFLRIPRISRATRDYATTYDPGNHELKHLVRVWASSERWILMDFVPGTTLGEKLNTESVRPRLDGLEATYFNRSGFTASQLRIDLIEKFGKELFLALADLEELGIQHSDLTPANITVTATDDGGESLCLIDLGVNYLHLHSTEGCPISSMPRPRSLRGSSKTSSTVNRSADC
ncbi:MAG: hypothetical protein ACRDTA_13615 [Pseudonocardiaceae bacterium]